MARHQRLAKAIAACRRIVGVTRAILNASAKCIKSSGLLARDKLRYKVLIDDNFHYMDEESRIEHGIFKSPEKAIAACRRIVDESLRHLHEPGMSEAELIAQYTFFGDDPFIVTLAGTGDASQPVLFLARDYARDRCAAICG